MLRLKHLKVKGVRGIVDGPNLHFANGGLLLCGDNGTGKSSYIDALEKVLTGKCGSLDSGGRDLSWRKQGPHVGTSITPEIELTLTDGENDFCVTLDTKIAEQGEQIREFLNAARQQSFILRRRTLLDFIDAAPRERYQAIQGFLNLDDYVGFETKIKRLRKDVETRISIGQDSMLNHEQQLKTHLKVETATVLTEDICKNAIDESLRTVGVEALQSLDDISSRLRTVDALLKPFDNIEILQQAKQLEKELEEIPNTEVLLNAARKYAESRKRFLQEESNLKGHFYAQVLQQGLSWIKEDKLELCPLCNSPIDFADVERYVNKRIEENEKLIQAKQNLANARKSFLQLLEYYNKAFEKIGKKWQEVFEKNLPPDVDKVILLFKQLQKSYKQEVSAADIEADIQRIDATDLSTHVQSLRKSVRVKLSSFPDSTRYSQLFNAKQRMLAVDTHWEKIQIIKQSIQDLEHSKSQIDIISMLAESGRKQAVQELLNNVVEIADSYFQKIHPEENIGEPQLTMTDRGTASIKLSSKFYSEEGDPRGHYSEGHVDSLGLCLFLAIRRIHHTQHPNLSLLILDDVLHSVDANHRRDTANLIFEEFSDHQIIITTHDPLWFEYLKQASRKTKKRFIQRRIATWSLATGPVWGDHLSNYEWLVSKDGKRARPSDKVLKAGLLLEEMLQNLCNNLLVSVPFRIRGDYTIDPLWVSFYSAAKKNKSFYEQAKSCLGEIDDLRSLRNWVGAHWNEWAQTLTDKEAERFVKAVLDLRNYVYCEDCNQFIRRIADLDGVWSCKREHKRYDKKK